MTRSSTHIMTDCTNGVASVSKDCSRARDHLHLSLTCGSRWGNTDDFTTASSIFFCSPLPSGTWRTQSLPFLDVIFHLFFCLSCLLPSFTAPCKMVLARPDERQTCPYHFSLRLLTMVRGSSCGPIACWILARTDTSVTWSL